MKLINTKESYCMYCLSEPRKVISLKIVDNEIDMCEDCLTKALLMIRPMGFDRTTKQKLSYFLKIKLYSSIPEEKGDDILYEKFRDWIKPFLEAKE